MVDSNHTRRIAEALEAIAAEKKEQTQILSDLNSNILQMMVDIRQIANANNLSREEIEGFLDGVHECRRAGLL